MQKIKEYKKEIEIGIGTCVFFFSVVKTMLVIKRKIPVFRNYHNFTKMKNKDNFQCQRFINDPKLFDHVIIPNLIFKPDPQTFKKHLAYIDDYKKEVNQIQSYPQKLNSFQATIIDKNTKHRVLCNIDSNVAFLSSTLLCNILNIHHNNIKTDITMLAYGKLRYNSQKKVFQFEGQCFGTTKQEIVCTWQNLLGSYLGIKIFFLGIGIGIGTSLLIENRQAIEIYIEMLKNKYKEYQQ